MVIVRELRAAVRVLLASPGFLVLGSVMLAMGIAATTFVFSVVNGVLLKDSRLPDLSKIVNVSLTYNGESRPDMGLTARRFEALLARGPRSIEQITAVRHLQLAFDGGTQSRIVMAESVTRDYFGLLRVRPAAGRFLNPTDDDMGVCCSVVVSYRVALQEFGSAERAIGQQVRLSGWPFTIVGVAREEFRGLTFPTMIGAELWINQEATTVALGSDQSAHPSRVFGRVADQTTLAVAAKELRSIGVGIDPKPEIGLTALPADDAVMPTGAVRASTVFGAVLLGLSGLILVAGVSNLTNLCAVRVARRTTEFAVRLALGARRVDLAYLFISEVLLVTVCGALMGWPLAVWAARALQRSTFPEMGGIIVNVDLAPDLRVAMFTVALTVVTTIGVSLAVLKRVLDSESVSVLARGVNVGLATWQRRSLRVALAVQVASAVVLLVPAGLFLRSAITKTHNLPQLGVDHALIGRFDLRLQRISEEKGQAIYAAILGQAARSAKVAGATLATDVPIDGRGPVVTLGAPGETGGVRARQLVVSPTFFEFLGIGLIRGRAFQASDSVGSESVVILSHSAAEAMWGQGDPIGRRVRVGDRGETRTVVGVVADVDESAQVELRRYAYLAQEQAHDPSLALLVRLRGAIPQRVEEIRSVVREADSGLALINATTLRDYIGLAASASKTAATAALIMAGVAWLICLGGVYAVAEYGSAARRREFGMRVALGATRIGIVRLVLQQTIPSVSRGVLAGWSVALAAAGLLHVYWPSAAPWDWATIMSIPVLAGTVCFGAAVLPAWRASGVSPKDVLHE